MKCPYCGSLHFYLKDQEDEYETHDFVLQDQQVCFTSGEAEGTPVIGPESDIYCHTCSWHGKLSQIS